jgi:hypothetical protein
LAVDAKDEQTANFYRHHGFADFGGSSGHLILALAK